MRPLYKVLVIVMMLVLLGWCVARPHQAMVPIRLGTAEDFWAAAAGVREKNILGGPSWCLSQPINGWFLYTSNHMHGSDFYRVPEADVITKLPKKAGELAGEDRLVSKWSEEGFRNWNRADPKGSNALLLLHYLRAARSHWANENRSEDILMRTEPDFDIGVAWQRMEQFPLVQVMEWGYLSFVILFAAWPWLRNSSRWRWAIHAALIPPLLMFPYFLGYCAWNYTSAGPGGGVVYPYILNEFRPLPWISFDSTLIKFFPQILARLTGPLGPMMTISGGRHAGPAAVGLLGLGLGLAVLAYCYVIEWISRRFERKPIETIH
jgi:hypothetical protein